MLHTIPFGDITIHRILELEAPFLRPDEIEPHRHWLEPTALDPISGKLILPVQSYVVKTQHHTILIDTCIGCNKINGIPDWNNRNDQTWLNNLNAAGFTPADIDFVFCTHLHSDHCGWNTKLLDGRWVPTFANAQYILAKSEVAATEIGAPNTYTQNVLPILEAGQARLVETDYALNNQIWLTPAPGHTVGHVCINIRSNGHHAIMIGDMLHSPLQLAHPDWSPNFDTNPVEATQTRTTFLNTHCETETFILTAHLPSPSVGHIVEHKNRPFDFKYAAQNRST
jgi:glyoxylase-like metal-dependent hydrolase (beta-lactamase superfamily II)